MNDRRITVGPPIEKAVLVNTPCDTDTATYQVEANQSQLVQLEIAISDLESKLAPVTEVHPVPGEAQANPNPCTTRLAQDIWSHGQRIWELTRRLETLTRNVKV